MIDTQLRRGVPASGRKGADRVDVDRPETSLTGVLARRPGWPLVLLFVAYPLWWALGLADVVTFIAVGAMAVELARLRVIRVPAGFGVWLLFLCWVALGVLLVQVNAPGAVAGSSATRYLTWSWRLLWYLKATVVLLYIGNQRARLSATWVCRVFSWMFVYIVAGGLLGVIAPRLQFRSLAELVLPRGFSSIPFVASLIHPVAAESFFSVLGDAAGRASAPFAYSNVWGLNFACFLPFFVVAWLGRQAGMRRVVAPIILAIALIPVVASLNRGLWVALIAAAVFVAVRAAIAGRVQLLAALVAGLALAAVVVAFSPLGSTVSGRLSGSGPTSNSVRDSLSALSLSSVSSTSPILGFGTTRNLQGNFDSIAGGSTSFCPRCSVPALGTQGQFSLVSFTQGIGGILLYFGFLALQLIRYVRMRVGYAVAAVTVLLVHFVTAAVYSADNLAIVPIFGALALAWRARVEWDLSGAAAGSDGDGSYRGDLYSDEEPTLAAYTGAVRGHWRSLVGLTLVGLLAGGGLAYEGGVRYVGAISVLVPVDAVDPTGGQLGTTLDTIAQSVTSATTIDAMNRASGGRAVDPAKLSVTATPNTRILHLGYVGDSATTASQLVTAAAQSVIAQHLAQLNHHRQQRLAALSAQAAALKSALQIARSPSGTGHPTGAPMQFVSGLLARTRDVNVMIAEVEELQVDGGSISSAVSVAAVHGSTRVDVAGGAALALLAWAGAVSMGRSRGARLGPRLGLRLGLRLGPRLGPRSYPSARNPSGGPPVLPLPASAAERWALLARAAPSAVIAVGTDRAALVAASELDSVLSTGSRRHRPVRVLLVAASTEREGALRQARRDLQRCGAQVAGLVLVERPGGAGAMTSVVKLGERADRNPYRMLRRRWLPLVAVPLIAATLAGGYARSHPGEYVSSVRVAVTPIPGNPFYTAAAGTAQLLTRAMTSEAILATSETVRAAASHQLGRAINDPAAIASAVIANTQMIKLTFTAPTAAAARAGASAVADAVLTSRQARAKAELAATATLAQQETKIAQQGLAAAAPELSSAHRSPVVDTRVRVYKEQLANLQIQTSQLQVTSTDPGSVVSAPTGASRSWTRSTWLFALGAGAIALLLGLGWVRWRTRREELVRGATLTSVRGRPVLAVPGSSASGDSTVGELERANAYRRTAACLLASAGATRVIVICSVGAEEAAEGMAKGTQDGAADEVGSELTRSFDDAGLTVASLSVRSGSFGTVGDAFSGFGLRRRVQDLARRHELVVVTAAPIDSSAGLAAALVGDGLVLTAIDGVHTRAQVHRAFDEAARLRRAVLGLVLISPLPAKQRQRHRSLAHAASVTPP